MKRRLTFLCTVLIALVGAAMLHGCSDPKANVAGTYELDKAAIKTAAEAEMKSKGENSQEAMGAGFILGMIDQMTITLTLNADGTATMNTNAMGQTKSSPGTWTLSGNSITLTNTADGSGKPSTGTVSGDTITLKPPADEDMPFDMVFKKKK